MHRPQPSWRITICGSMYILLKLVFFRFSLKQQLSTMISVSAKSTVTLCSPQTLISVTRTSQICRSSSSNTRPCPRVVKLSVVKCCTPGQSTHHGRHLPDTATAIQYIHSSSRVRDCQQATSARQCSVQRIGVGSKLKVRVPESARTLLPPLAPNSTCFRGRVVNALDRHAQ